MVLAVAVLMPAGSAAAATGPAGYAVLNVMPTSGQAPLTVSLDTTGTLGTVNSNGGCIDPSSWAAAGAYSLDFGDGTVVTGSVDSNACLSPPLPRLHTYTAAGAHTMTLTISWLTPGGQRGSDVASVDVGVSPPFSGPPAANLDPLGPLTGGAPYSLAFGQASLAPPGAQLVEEWYRWGDGTSTALSPDSLGQFIPQAHTYRHPGTYLTTLRVRTNDNVTDLDSEIITVTKAPSALVSLNGNVVTATKTLRASAFLMRTDQNSGEPGKLVNFYTANNAFVCGGYTDTSGYVSCTGGLGANVTVTENRGFYAAFLGDYDTVGATSGLKKPTVNQTNTSQRSGTGAGVTITPSRGQLSALSLLRVRGDATRKAARVMATVERSAGGSCRIVGGAKVRAFRGNCQPAGFRAASGAQRWSLALAPRLRAGAYQVYAYAVDAAGRPGTIVGASFQLR
jgi:PKD repeat protein